MKIRPDGEVETLRSAKPPCEGAIPSPASLTSRYYGIMRFFWGIVLLFLFIGLSMNFLVAPNTYLSQMNISFWPRYKVVEWLKTKSTDGIKVSINGETVNTSYKQLGMTLEVNKTAEIINGTNFIDRMVEWDRWQEIKLIQPIFTFQSDFDNNAMKSFPKKTLSNEELGYDDRSGQFTYSASRSARVDTTDLLTKLVTFSRESKKTIEVAMIEEASPTEKKIEEINTTIKRVLSTPLNVYIENNKKSINLSKDDLLPMLELSLKSDLSGADPTINSVVLGDYLTKSGVGDSRVNWIANKLNENLAQRLSGGYSSNRVVLGADDGPNTDGDIADKYIEVDLSQQKMYFFEKGKLTNVYPVSTGLNYPTPVGVYRIKNKLPMAYSSIFNVWMPWWMAFDYEDDIGAYLGIHELPYRLTNGEKIYRFGNYIGHRKTGGCIALSPGDSKEVYDKSYPGMEVLVYQ